MFGRSLGGQLIKRGGSAKGIFLMIGHHTWLHGLCAVQFQGVLFTKTAMGIGPLGAVQ